ncbi:MAG: hypothetical protein K8R92_11950 [Planctomycetes bacterium]|nr:hypothetical protein [Planctomycetota bacterium]
MVSTLLALSFAGAASASVSGMQGLYAHNYIVTSAGVEYSVMDVFIKYNSSVGTGTNGERVVNFGGESTTGSSTFGVDKHSKLVNSRGLAFQHSNTSWLPGSVAGNSTWDSFVTIGCRGQGLGASGSIIADPSFANPNSNVGSIIGTGGGAGVAQSDPLDPGFETNTTAYSDHMIMLGRFSLKTTDIAASGGLPTMTVWLNIVGKSTAQTGGTTLYVLAAANLKSDAQTQFTTNGKVWTFNSSFDGVDSGQAAWTFSAGSQDVVPVPGAAALMGLAGLVLRRRR